ncbi:hypothetical protein [Ascidiimonas sp. W6]|uniref:hypothetical protein n=1 Tax=Ascidiimonas meishanensis TaxID=3128903 RepID=UPI0030EBD4A9
MPIYQPRNNATKKSQILERRIFEFLQLRNLEKKNEKHLKLAEKVRQAQLNYLKARLSLSKTFSSENEPDLDLINKVKKEITEWESLSYDEIIGFCLTHSR